MRTTPKQPLLLSSELRYKGPTRPRFSNRELPESLRAGKSSGQALFSSGGLETRDYLDQRLRWKAEGEEIRWGCCRVQQTGFEVSGRESGRDRTRDLMREIQKNQQRQGLAPWSKWPLQPSKRKSWECHSRPPPREAVSTRDPSSDCC